MNEHSQNWGILRYQEKKHKREKAVLYTIIAILIVALVLSNIIWYARHNNETASAETPEIQTAAAATTTAAITTVPRICKRGSKKDWVSDVCLT